MTEIGTSRSNPVQEMSRGKFSFQYSAFTGKLFRQNSQRFEVNLGLDFLNVLCCFNWTAHISPQVNAIL